MIKPSRTRLTCLNALTISLSLRTVFKDTNQICTVDKITKEEEQTYKQNSMYFNKIKTLSMTLYARLSTVSSISRLAFLIKLHPEFIEAN